MCKLNSKQRLQAQINGNTLIVHGQGERGERRGKISEGAEMDVEGEREFEWSRL